jgi:hypothetical protein
VSEARDPGSLGCVHAKKLKQQWPSTVAARLRFGSICHVFVDGVFRKRMCRSSAIWANEVLCISSGLGVSQDAGELLTAGLSCVLHLVAPLASP